MLAAMADHSLSSQRLALIVPVLNEAEALPDLLAHLSTFAADDVVFVDGGSADASVRLIESHGLQVISSRRGRASQMNAGAARTTADILLFLHADTRLPTGALDDIRRAMADPSVVGGRFDLSLDGGGLPFRIIASMINVRSRLSRISTGDQAMFVRRATFEQLGGFPDQPLMEDVELSRRLKRLGRIACLRRKALSSSRRWQRQGVWRTVWLMWSLRWRYWLGASPAELKLHYPDHGGP